MREHADGVAADAEIGGVAEAHHPAIAEDEVEADGGEPEDDNAGEQREHEQVAAERDIDRQQRERGEQHEHRDIADGQRVAHFRTAGNNPSGRATRTIAISR